jgi:hypothetical protein
MRIEDAVTFHGLQGRQPCKGGYPRRKGPLLPLREDAFAGAAKVRNPLILPALNYLPPPSVPHTLQLTARTVCQWTCPSSCAASGGCSAAR